MKPNFFDLYKKDAYSNPLKELFVSCLNIFFPLDALAQKIPFFDKLIEKEGIGKTASELLKYLKIKITTNNLKKLDKKSGYLIFGNHPMFLDPILILTVIKEDKMKFLGLKFILKIGSNFAKHVFPIQNLQIVNGKRRKKHLWDDWFFKFFLPSLGECNLREKAVVFNREQVEKSAQFLAKKGKLLIFPCGHGRSLNKKNWKNGIGFILSKAIQKYGGKNIKLLPFFINIKHSCTFQLKALSRFRKPSNLNIYFGKEIDASKYSHLTFDPRKLTRRIGEEYRDFIRSLK